MFTGFVSFLERDDVTLINNKRMASIQQGSPRKRQSCASQPTEVAVKDVKGEDTKRKPKRKPTAETGTPSQKQRVGNNFENKISALLGHTSRCKLME